jgi:CHAT domain-containing protein/Flp pilus assembly protein TadD
MEGVMKQIEHSSRHSGIPERRGMLMTAIGMVFLSLLLTFAPYQASGQSPASAEQEMAQGRRFFTQGSFPQAATHWMEAARLYEEQGKAQEQSQALTDFAYALQQEGLVRESITTLQSALQLTEKIGDRVQTATILGRLGNAAVGLGQGDSGVEHLTKATTLARDANDAELLALLLNDLGNALTETGQHTEAADVYAESKNLAGSTDQAALAVIAQTNLAKALFEVGQLPEAEQQLDIAYAEIQRLEDAYSKAYGLLNIGLAYEDLRQALSSPRIMAQEPSGQSGVATRGIAIGGTGRPTPPAEKEIPSLRQSNSSLLRQASDSFVAAAQVATRLQDARAQSYAWGYLGELLEKEGRYSEALEFTRRAVLAAQKEDAPESSYRWQWQTARLLRMSGKPDEALAAYQRAVTILKPIRYEYSVGYQSRHRSFQHSVAPLFTELEDVLLRRAADSPSPHESQRLLVQVRDTVEMSRTAELQDYFRDDCVGKARSLRAAASIPSGTAVVYPIMLPDRLELLVDTGQELHRYAVAVGGAQLTNEVRAFRRTVQDRRSSNYLPHAKQLYTWLIAPVQGELASRNIQTLVFVPDGPLRTIPIAALHDGQHFAIEKYAIAVTPSMELTDTRPIDRRHFNLLSLGLTESVQGFPALPNVAEEVDTLKILYGGKLLLNGEFLVPSMEREMKQKAVGVVHIASHGVVENDVSKSFLLAYDDKITMNRLSQLVGLLQYRQEPLELLTLSACETAIGDDRAALGLAGMAVKAGARSALATLWFIDDKATSELVAEFYRQLRDPAATKALALQRAQLMIMNEPGHQHPSFWAPFLMINNWM